MMSGRASASAGVSGRAVRGRWLARWWRLDGGDGSRVTGDAPGSTLGAGGAGVGASVGDAVGAAVAVGRGVRRGLAVGAGDGVGEAVGDAVGGGASVGSPDARDREGRLRRQHEHRDERQGDQPRQALAIVLAASGCGRPSAAPLGAAG